ncbi:phosphopantothenate--cysteine ligase-like isoform X2 [Uloborus diversus]|uniref:phosphopantothenate--cysteine ligase-like isoform X2 n=1 Tax=Uloborus diversus TaxID=327109 RepID=UPI002409D7DB|nr:phosphopantothenate--cysteine ligase-like isoform X2 [Uloborus diversus]
MLQTIPVWCWSRLVEQQCLLNTTLLDLLIILVLVPEVHHLQSCAVIFLHRSKSLEPFVRHVPVSDLMESLVTEQAVDGNWSITVHGDLCNKLAEISNEYKRLCAKKMLIKIPFTTLSSYFHILYEASHALKPMGRNAILYLAAAVSDFYIPRQEMATHKISSDEELSLNLRMVPKLLQPLVRYWVPDAFVVSFKLETDESILISKARKALERYQHKLVIGNELNSRKYKVTLVTKTEEKSIILNQEEISEGKEIEEKIVEELFKYYEKL